MVLELSHTNHTQGFMSFGLVRIADLAGVGVVDIASFCVDGLRGYQFRYVHAAQD